MTAFVGPALLENVLNLSLIGRPDPDLSPIRLKCFLLRIVDERVEESVFAFQVTLSRFHFGEQRNGALSSDEGRRKSFDLPRKENFSLTHVQLFGAFGDRVFVVAVDVAVGNGRVAVGPMDLVSL
jgi:hypothetical protein